MDNGFLKRFYGKNRIFEAEITYDGNYKIYNGKTGEDDYIIVNHKCFEKVLPKEMTIDEISEALGYEVKIKQPKFKVGDKVIGNEKASDEYGITTKGWRGIVDEVYEDYFIADDYVLKYDCFDKLEI